MLNWGFVSEKLFHIRHCIKYIYELDLLCGMVEVITQGVTETELPQLNIDCSNQLSPLLLYIQYFGLSHASSCTLTSHTYCQLLQCSMWAMYYYAPTVRRRHTTLSCTFMKRLCYAELSFHNVYFLSIFFVPELSLPYCTLLRKGRRHAAALFELFLRTWMSLSCMDLVLYLM